MKEYSRKMVVSILYSSYGLGELHAPVHIFKALAELLEIEIVDTGLTTDLTARMKAYDLIAETMMAWIENDRQLPAYDAVKLKAAAMKTPTKIMAIEEKLVEISGSTITEPDIGKVRSKRNTKNKKAKETEKDDDENPNEQSKGSKARNA